MSEPPTVLVIFAHELLGAGLCQELAALGVRAATAPSGAPSRVSRALRRHPRVVVLETTDVECRALVDRLSPRSRVVDVTTSVGVGCPREAVGFDAVLAALAPEPTP